MSIEQILDHAAAAAARLPSQHSGKVKLPALVSSLAGPAQGVEDALWALLIERSVDTAVGAQLDRLGAIVGEPRNGLVDAHYRRHVRARIAANRSRGCLADILNVADLVVYDDGARYVYQPQYPAAYALQVADVAIDATVAGFVARFLHAATSAGVRVLLEFSPVVPAETFQLGDSDDVIVMTGKGFADVNAKSLNLERSSSQYAAITDAAQTGLDIVGAITIGARVKFESLPGAGDRYTILSKWQGTDRSWRLYLTDSTGLKLTFFLSDDGSNDAGVSCAFTPAVDVWYTIIAQFDPAVGGAMASKCKLWINGVSQALTSINAPIVAIFDGAADFEIGASLNGAADYFDGLIDDAFVYDGVLDADAVADFAAGIPPARPLTDYGIFCRFEDDYTDETANGNDLTPSGSPTFEPDVMFEAADLGGAFAGVIEGA